MALEAEVNPYGKPEDVVGGEVKSGAERLPCQKAGNVRREKGVGRKGGRGTDLLAHNSEDASGYTC